MVVVGEESKVVVVVVVMPGDPTRQLGLASKRWLWGSVTKYCNVHESNTANSTIATLKRLIMSSPHEVTE